jgi:hypothetical protein
MKVPGPGGWHEDPLWATSYDWTVEHPRTGGALWRVGMSSERCARLLPGRQESVMPRLRSSSARFHA